MHIDFPINVILSSCTFHFHSIKLKHCDVIKVLLKDMKFNILDLIKIMQLIWYLIFKKTINTTLYSLSLFFHEIHFVRRNSQRTSLFYMFDHVPALSPNIPRLPSFVSAFLKIAKY